MQERAYSRNENGEIVSNGHDRHMGRKRAARLALRSFREQWNDRVGDRNGMRFMGCGAFRSVYAPVKPDGYAYKVARRNNDNEAEYEACHALRIVEGSIAPPTRILYIDGTAILIMPEYVNDHAGVSPPSAARYGIVSRHHHLPDMHHGNYRATRDGHVRITDLGFGASLREKAPSPKQRKVRIVHDGGTPERCPVAGSNDEQFCQKL